MTLEGGLYGASAEDLLERIRLVPEAADSVMLIGHNPGLHELALVLAAAGRKLERLERRFPTAALATLTPLDTTTWSQLSRADAVLAAYVVPKQLR